MLGARPDIVERMGLADRTELVRGGRLLTQRNYRLGSFALVPWLGHGNPIDGNLLSSSYAFAHHLRCTGTHVCYCHSPLRQIWSHRDAYASSAGSARGHAIRVGSGLFRKLDARAAALVDRYIATSSAVKARIEAFYGREVDFVIPPPVDLADFQPIEAPTRDFFLWAGRIVEPYKKLEELMRAFRGRPELLIVAGDGRDAPRLRAAAPENVQFVGEVSTPKLADLYANAIAVIFPSEDDFGMVPVESMASGTPVVAYRAGGALDTVRENLTGVFFDSHEPDAIQAAINESTRISWNSSAIRSHAEDYSLVRFVAKMKNAMADI